MYDFEKLLEKGYEEYWSSVARVAKIAFDTEVVPFCVKHKLNFSTPGLGDDFALFITSDTPQEFVDEYGLVRGQRIEEIVAPKELLDILNLPIPGSRVKQPLGSVMPNFKWIQYAQESRKVK